MSNCRGAGRGMYAYTIVHAKGVVKHKPQGLGTSNIHDQCMSGGPISDCSVSTTCLCLPLAESLAQQGSSADTQRSEDC